MNVALINKSDMKGGAARAARRLSVGLRSLGVDTSFIVKEKASADRNTFDISPPNPSFRRQEVAFREMEKKCLLENRSAISDAAFSLPYPGYDLSSSAFVRDADVVNLHHIRDFQSVESIARILNLNKPVVWTLHDQSAFTGGCHYASGCARYQVDCQDCPQLEGDSRSIPQYVLQNKIRNWLKYENLSLVTPSRWLADCARKSALFRNSQIEHIPNALEVDVFKPIPKLWAKKELHLNPESLVILVGSMNLNLKRKGFQYFLDSIDCCLQNPAFAKDLGRGSIQLLSFGKKNHSFDHNNFFIRTFGKIDEDEKLLLLYSAADIFVLPSLEDNFPNNMLEALACGTPVIAFAVGGIPEVVIHGTTGLLVPPRNAGQMGLSIQELIGDRNAREKMGRQGAALVKKEFNLQTQAQRYRRLFESLQSNDRGEKRKRDILADRKEMELRGSEIDPLMYAQLKPVFSAFGIER